MFFNERLNTKIWKVNIGFSSLFFIKTMEGKSSQDFHIDLKIKSWLFVSSYRTSVGRESSIRLLNNGSSKLWGRNRGSRSAANNNTERTKENYSKCLVYKADSTAPFPKCCETENGVKHVETRLDGKDVSTESFYVPIDGAYRWFGLFTGMPLYISYSVLIL